MNLLATLKIFSFSESEDCGYQPPVSEHVDANDENIDDLEKKLIQIDITINTGKNTENTEDQEV